MKSYLPKTYTPADYEEDIYYKWESSGYFNPDNLPEKRKKAFTISLPPPNVTGKLHIGHAVMLAYQDIMIRYQRLRGKKTLWLPGMDHAAIATQTVVEKELNKEGQTRHDLGKEKFLERINKFVEESKAFIRCQIKATGASLDWSREKFTLDQDLTSAVRTAFKKMYDDGLIYRGNRVVNWCSKCQTTLADDEVEYEEVEGKLYYIKYGPITIATTRPETKLGDSGVAVNPQDKKYKNLVGQVLEVDLAGQKIKVKVFADRAVDQSFGSGAIGVTPAHSHQDADWAKKHGLESIKVIDEKGLMTEKAGKYQGLLVLECRQQFVKDLEKAGLLERVEDYINNLSICYRCNTPIEPLPSKQWFVDVNKKIPNRGKSLKELANKVVKNGDIKIIPDRFNKTYFQWMDNLRDWCISRQIWYGHQIPVWYKKSNKKMGFYEKVILQIYQGKTKTYRLKDHQFKVGDVVDFENSQTSEIFGQGKIVNVEKTVVDQLDLQDKAHGATYQTVEELIKAFKKHYPDKEITAKTPVIIYEYRFKEVERNQNIYVGIEPPTGDDWVQDPDTLDTWFSSALWTFSTLGWPKQTEDLKTFHPTSIMETGYDLIFFWVARMIMMSLYALKEVPFRTVYFHGLVRTKEGEKMSKSKPETCINPLVMIKKFGTDALRLSMIIGATPGNDTRLYEEKIAGYRNFVNKLWNIGRYILSSVKGVKRSKTDDLRPARHSPACPARAERAGEAKPTCPLCKAKHCGRVAGGLKTLADEWIIQEFNQIVQTTTKNIEEYKFSPAGEELYEFTWSKLADWYLEIAKIEGDASTSSTHSKDEILLYILEKLLILWHPFCPFVTEVLWDEFKSKELLMIQSWPETKDRGPKTYNQIEKDFGLIQEIVTSIRNVRAENKIDPKKTYSCSIKSKKEKLINANKPIIEGLAKVKITPRCPGLKIHLPEADITLDIKQNNELIKNREKELINLKRYIEIQEKKLVNSQFIKKAPQEVVTKERGRLQQAKDKLKKLLS